MIQRDDILSIEFLKKTEFTGCHKGMRYRLEKAQADDGETKLKCTVWPEPFNYFKTPDNKKESGFFFFEEDGIVDAVAWMNDKLFREKDKWENAAACWDSYE